MRGRSALRARRAAAEADFPDFAGERVLDTGYEPRQYNEKVSQLLSAAGVPHDPVALSWRRLRCTVPAERGGAGTVLSPLAAALNALRSGFARTGRAEAKAAADEPKDATVLDGVSGHLDPGQMCVILGPAGCGASLLLGRLDGRDLGKVVDVEGDVLYNGREKLADVVYTPHFLRSVPQLDEHFPWLSVRRTLEFAVACKVPEWIPYYRAIRKNQVLLVADTLGISRVLDTRVGSDALRGVSGGERRRVSIAETVVGVHPGVVTLDNWSKGLDSATTLSITRALRRLADDQGMTTVCSMTSPGVDVYNNFDVVTVLDKGRLLYFGPREDAEHWFNSLGFYRPQQRSVPDFLSTVSNPLFRETYLGMPIEQEDGTAPKTPEEFADRFASSTLSKSLHENIDKASSGPLKEPGVEPQPEVLRRATRTNLEGAGRQFKNLFGRQLALFVARKGEYAQEYLVKIIFGVLLGSMFWQLPETEEGTNSRTGLLFLVVIFLAIESLSKLPEKHWAKRVFFKQRARAFYDPLPFIVSSAFTDCIIDLIGTLFFVIPLWLMSGLQLGSSGQRLLYAILVLWIIQVVMSMQTRALVAIFPEEKSAQAISGIITMLIIVMAGYLRTGDELAGYIVWIYWINPLHYAYEALVLNEFDGLQFTCNTDELLPQDPRVPVASRVCPVSSGEAYLEDVLGITEDEQYRLYYFLILAAFAVVYVLLAAVATKFVRPRGYAYKLPPVTADPNNPTAGDSVYVDVEGDEAKGHGSSLTFVGLKYSVENGAKLLLDSVTGCVPPGKLVALVGTSGAGKTTLLDTVAGRKTLKGGASQEGEVRLDGIPVTSEQLASVSGYCEQSDLHILEATVREALRFGAVLRLPKETSVEDRNARVRRVLDMLDLTPFAGILIKSLGAAELKLMTLGLELVADPAVMFCDEPTSGLPTSSALRVIRALRTVADTGTAVVCTIHQPSSEIFTSFDRLLFLQRGGRTVYAGEIGLNGKAVRSYFESQGVAPAGEEANTAEWMLEAVADENVDWHERWNESEAKATYMTEVEKYAAPASGSPSEVSVRKTAGLAVQIRETMKRTFWRYFRLPDYNLFRVIMLSMMAIIFGIVFLRDASDNGQGAVIVVTAALYLSLVPSTIVIQNVIPVSFDARLPFYREIMSGTYNPIAHHISFGVVEIPFLFVAATFFTVIYYFLVGLTPSKFGYFFLAAQLLYIYSVYLGLALSAVLPSLNAALTLANIIAVICNVLSGFLLRKPSMPVYWRWFTWVNPFAYFLSGVLQNEFAGREFVCSASELGAFALPDSAATCAQIDADLYADVVLPGGGAGCSFCPIADGQAVIDVYDADAVNKWLSLVALVVAVVVMRTIAAFGFVHLRFLTR